MEAIIIHPRNKEQLTALKVVFKEMKISFEKAKKENVSIVAEEESPYDPEFVAMIRQANEDLKKGKGKTMKLDDIWK